MNGTYAGMNLINSVGHVFHYEKIMDTDNVNLVRCGDRSLWTIDSAQTGRGDLTRFMCGSFCPERKGLTFSGLEQKHPKKFLIRKDIAKKGPFPHGLYL